MLAQESPEQRVTPCSTPLSPKQSKGLNSSLWGNEAWQLKSPTDNLKEKKKGAHTTPDSPKKLALLDVEHSVSLLEWFPQRRLSGKRPWWVCPALSNKECRLILPPINPLHCHTPRAANRETRIRFIFLNYAEGIKWASCKHLGSVNRGFGTSNSLPL